MFKFIYLFIVIICYYCIIVVWLKYEYFEEGSFENENFFCCDDGEDIGEYGVFGEDVWLSIGFWVYSIVFLYNLNRGCCFFN